MALSQSQVRLSNGEAHRHQSSATQKIVLTTLLMKGEGHWPHEATEGNHPNFRESRPNLRHQVTEPDYAGYYNYTEAQSHAQCFHA